jgi:hypothetical protein
MAQTLKGFIGETLQADGAGPDSGFRQGKTGEVIVSELHGRYYETALRGRSYSAANQAAQAVSVALATTYTGILLFNPLASGFNLVPNKVKFALSVAPAAIATIGLINGFSATGGVTAQTTPLTPTSNIIGSPKGVGIALSAATIVNPTWLFQLYDGFTAAALPSPTLPVDLEGMFVIPPGGFIGIGALTAVTGLGSISWEEVPIR